MSSYSNSLQSILVNSSNISKEQDRTRKSSESINEHASNVVKNVQRLQEESVVGTQEQNDSSRVKDDEERMHVQKRKKKEDEPTKNTFIKDDKLGTVLDISC